MTRPVLSAAIAGSTVTGLMAASWSLGPSGFLASLAPSTASLTFTGTVSAALGAPVVITSDAGTQWSGTLDTLTVSTDEAGLVTSTVTATDDLGRMGAATLNDVAPAGGTVATIAGTLATDKGGSSLSFQDDSFRTAPVLDSWAHSHSAGVKYTGSVLGYVQMAAEAANMMLAWSPDGVLHGKTRERTPYLPNGTFDTNTTGWAGVAGGAISRVTASPHAGAGNGRIVSGAGAYAGADHAIGDSSYAFTPLDTIRLSMWARSISGSTAVLWGIGNGSDSSTAVITLTGSWALYTIDWTPTAPRTACSVFLRNNGTNNTFEVDSLSLAVVPITLTGLRSFDLTTSIDVDINRWSWQVFDVWYVNYEDTADVAAYGERPHEDTCGLALSLSPFADWGGYGGSQRPLVSATYVISDASQTELMLLQSFQWVTIGAQAWMVLSLSHDYSWDGVWTVTIGGDDLLARL